MSTRNQYCCRCHSTRSFLIKGTTYTCMTCGLVVEPREEKKEERILIGNPLRSFKTSFAT